MTPLILLGVVAGIPVALAFLLRVNAVFLFLSVAAGNVLVTSMSDDADLALGMVAGRTDTALIARLVLQLLPVALTLFFLKKTIPMHKILLHLLPIIATGLMLAVFVLPMLPDNMKSEVFDGPYGDVIEDVQDVVVGVAAVTTLALAWLSYRNIESKRGKGK